MANEIIPIEEMSGEDYEKYCAQYLRDQGFTKINLTKITDDYGADITAFDQQGIKWVFQCKRYSSSVGKDAVQEVAASKAHYNATIAAVITNSRLTEGAKTLAKENNVRFYEGVSPSLGYYSSQQQPKQGRASFVSMLSDSSNPISEPDHEGGKFSKGLLILVIILLATVCLGVSLSYIDDRKSQSKGYHEDSAKQTSMNNTSETSKVIDQTETPIATTTTEVETTISKITYRVIVNTGRIRIGPGTDTDTLCLVYLNDELVGTGNTEKVGNTIWYEVYYNDSGETGWASEIVISPVE